MAPDVESFLLGRYRWSERPREEGPGVYAYFALGADALAPVDVEPEYPLYIGMTESSLEARCHFDHQHSGFSTLRRSLGALLKEQLGLSAIPRAPGPSKFNWTSFRFHEAGEVRLTEWMRAHLLYAHFPVFGDVRATERELISASHPPLNLMGWRNPQRGLIRAARRRCAIEARASLANASHVDRAA